MSKNKNYFVSPGMNDTPTRQFTSRLMHASHTRLTHTYNTRLTHEAVCFMPHARLTYKTRPTHASRTPHTGGVRTVMIRVGLNHIECTVYTRYFWQEKRQIYGHIQCIYTVLANPSDDGLYE